MNKFNKLSICTMFIFIVLMFSNVMAGSAEPGEGNGLPGSGTVEDPYIINVNSGAPNQSYTFEKVPFFFKVVNSGTYDITADMPSKTVTFTYTGSKTEKTRVLLNKDDFSNVSNWQAGVTPALDESGTGISQPTYDIEEKFDYRCTPNVYIASWAVYTSTLGGQDENGSYKEDGIDASYMYVRRSSLHNVAIPGNVAATKSTSYFFAGSNDTSLINLIKPLGYKSIGDYYKTDLLENAPVLRISEDVANVTYCFNGLTNTALNDDGTRDTDIEALLSRIFIWIGDDLLLGLLRDERVLGSDLTIDALIFNKYDRTKLDLYNEKATGINKALRDVVNPWYRILLNLTYVLYIIILIYIGIKILLSIGSPTQNKAMSYLANWIVGLVFLWFIPNHGIPLLFKLNDALVEYIGNNRSTMESYYNFYNSDEYRDILGSDSSTISIENLLSMRDKYQLAYNQLSSESKALLRNIRNDLSQTLERRTGKRLTSKESQTINDWLNRLYINYKYNLDRGETHEETTKILRSGMQMNLHYAPQSGLISREVAVILKDIFFNEGKFNELIEKYQQLYENDKGLEFTEHAIEVVQLDIMGTMRAYAGKYQRLIFVVIWYMLLFQMIGLTFLYFKRIFIIAILIAVFPLIMLSYAIDKIGDGSSQTMKLWFKELLANIFIQSVHAVIYMVFVEMGLKIYSNDSNDWIFLVASMLMILPAETIMKEIFDLNGSTLGKIGGGLMKTALAVGALKTFATAGKSGKDASRESGINKNFARLQNSQNRADAKARTRAAVRARTPGKPMSGYDKFREGAYHAATGARKAAAKVAPAAETALRVTRNAVSTTAGAMYGIASGGSVEDMMQGAMVAKAMSGKTQDVKDRDLNLKTNLSAAYKRKKNTK